MCECQGMTPRPVHSPSTQSAAKRLHGLISMGTSAAAAMADPILEGVTALRMSKEGPPLEIPPFWWQWYEPLTAGSRSTISTMGKSLWTCKSKALHCSFNHPHVREEPSRRAQQCVLQLRCASPVDSRALCARGALPPWIRVHSTPEAPSPRGLCIPARALAPVGRGPPALTPGIRGRRRSCGAPCQCQTSGPCSTWPCAGHPRRSTAFPKAQSSPLGFWHRAQ